MSLPANSDACVFALTQITGDFGCDYGELVTRRAGPDIACSSEQMHKKCVCVYEHLKRAGLSAFGYEDDLTQVPHGIWAKIQYGGLLALQSESGVCDDESGVSNIASVIQATVQQNEDLDQNSFVSLVPVMQAFRIRRGRIG